MQANPARHEHTRTASDAVTNHPKSSVSTAHTPRERSLGGAKSSKVLAIPCRGAQTGAPCRQRGAAMRAPTSREPGRETSGQPAPGPAILCQRPPQSPLTGHKQSCGVLHVPREGRSARIPPKLRRWPISGPAPRYSPRLHDDRDTAIMCADPASAGRHPAVPGG